MKKNLRDIIRSIPKQLGAGLKLMICFAGLLLAHTALLAQSNNIKISGKVNAASGEALPGVTIKVKNANTSTVTDAAGTFTITAPQNAVLQITYIGYKMQEVAVSGRAALDVSLQVEPNTLGDVVVVGYSSQRRANITGAVSTVNMGDVDKRRVPDVAQLLQGQVAGVTVTQSTGAPGDGINVTIRGVGTIGSSSDPLYVVDGLPTTSISFINPADIQSMTVLKDAAAASIYGSRAAGGVVVIVTKSGRKGRSNLDISYFNGIQKVANLPTMLNASQYLNKMEESWNNSGYSGTNPYTADKARTDLANTDWLDELFVLGRSQNLQLTASGGSDKVQYLISGGYYGQNGIVVYDNDQFQRLSFRTNVNANVTDRFVVGTNLQISNSKQDKISSSGDAPGVIRHAFLRPPIIGVYKNINDSNYRAADPFTDLPFYTENVLAHGGSWDAGANRYEFASNPVAIAYFTNDKRTSLRTFGNVYGEFGFLRNKELKLKTNLGVDLNMVHNKAFRKNYGDDDGGGGADQGTGRQNRPSNLAEERGQQTTITWTNTATFNKKFDRHNVGILAGSEFITSRSSGISASRARYANTDPAFQYIDFGGFPQDLWNGGTESEWALFSLFGSVNYNFDSRYFATASVRLDKSSQFAEDKQQAVFPSFSAGWRISQEKFMQDVTWISDLKLRASTGKLGNQSGLSGYNSLKIYDVNGVLRRLGNPSLQWETTNQNNIGFDLGLFKNRVTITAEYFEKKTSDLLLPLSLPSFVGDFQPTIVNAGAVSNKGFEFSLGYRNNDRKLKYAVNANLATVTNRVDKLAPTLPNIYGQVSKTEPGHPLNSFYGFKMVGIYQNQKEIDDYLISGSHDNVKPGDIKFQDVNGDGVISEDKDRVYLGNPNPRLTYGANLSASYLGFDLNVLFQGVSGVEKYNDLKKIIDYDTRPFNHTTATLGAWHGEGTSNTIPRSTFTDNGSSKVSSIFVEDASYFRLKNIEIGYTVNFSGKLKSVFQNVRLFVSGQNLFTVTNYTGLDPEAYNMFDQGTYPQSKAFLFGINVKL
jgi:TonB-dependent starch-binding outer membrane protein SusC